MANLHDFQLGAFQAPLTQSLAKTFLKDTDPALWEALSFFEFCIEDHLGDRWRAELRDLADRGEEGIWNSTDGYTLGDSPEGALIAHSLSMDPVPYFQEQQFKFPLLALYRTKGNISMRTLSKHHIVSTWTLEFILPPMSPMVAEALSPVLRAIMIVIADRTEQGFDPAYDSARRVWTDAGIEKIRATDCDFSLFRLKDGNNEGMPINFQALTMSFEVSEMRIPSTDFESFTGIDGYMQIEPDSHHDNDFDFQVSGLTSVPDPDH